MHNCVVRADCSFLALRAKFSASYLCCAQIATSPGSPLRFCSCFTGKWETTKCPRRSYTLPKTRRSLRRLWTNLRSPIYSAGQTNIVKGCVSQGFQYATFDHVFWTSIVCHILLRHRNNYQPEPPHLSTITRIFGFVHFEDRLNKSTQGLKAL